MALANEVDSMKEAVDGQAHVWNHTFNFINSMALKAAIQLGIPDAIHSHGKPMTLSELADALPINRAKSNELYRLMRILVHSKFFDTVKVGGDEAYRLNRASRLLLRDEPTSMVPCVLALLDPVFVDIFQHTSEWLQGEDSSPFVTRHGRSVWEYAGFDQKWNKMFNEGMASDARLVTSAIALKEWKHVFEGMEAMVDVAGGTGTVAGAIAAAFPGLRCTVLDLPHVVAGLQGSKNLSYISGDMFEFIPPADAVFLKWILHDWGDEDCLKILKNCKEAIRASKKGGKVIIVDMVVGDQKEDEKIETQLLIDVLMYYSSGRERTEKEWANLFLTAGFTTYKINSVLGLRSVIEVFP